MIPIQKDLILASADPVAIDAVSARIMGFDSMKIDYNRLAHEDGLVVGRPGKIEVLGEDISALNFGFRVGDNLVSRIGDLIWFGLLRGMQKLFFRIPLVHLFVFGSYDCSGKRYIPFILQAESSALASGRSSPFQCTIMKAVGSVLEL